MIDKTFSATLKKYEPVRGENNIFIKIVIKHTNHGEIQTFLNPMSKKLALDFEQLFTFPVRWKKMVFDTSDYDRKTYNIKFGDVEFVADLDDISITHKFLDGAEIFEYYFGFSKESSKDTLDRLMAEAYLNYKEEDENGKKIAVEFDVTAVLLEKVQQELDTSIF